MTKLTKSPKQILTEAKMLIADEKTWCQGSYAKDAKGEPVGAMTETAACFCSMGAVSRSAGTDYWGHLTPITRLLDQGAIEVVKREHPDTTYSSIVDLNDGDEGVTTLTPHQAVMAAFDIAIGLAPAV